MGKYTERTEKWRYVVALGKFVVHLIYPGMTKAMSVLIPSMVFQLELDYTRVGFLVAMQFGVLYLTCPLSNYLSTKFGHRRVSSVGGFLSGVSFMMGAFFSRSALSLGFSFFFTGLFSSPLRQSSTVILREHFKENYGMVLTLTQMGGQVGGIILPYITVQCLNAYGMRGAFLCLSGILFYQTAIGATFRPPRLSTAEREKRCNNDKTDDEDSSLIRSRKNEISLHNKDGAHNLKDSKGSSSEWRLKKATWALIVEFFSSVLALDFLRRERVFTFLYIPCHILSQVSFAIWITFSVSYGVSIGLPENESVYLPIVGSLGGIIGRLILMRTLYKHPRLAPHMFPVNTAITSIALLAYPISSSIYHLLFCSFFAGFGVYGTNSTFDAAVALRYKNPDFPIAASIVFWTSGVVLLLSGTLAGLFYELFGSFKTTFMSTGAILSVTCAIFSTFLLVDARLKRHSSNEKR
nr:monocarboxylate transporter 1-like [Lytechinus pictus]